MISGLPWGLALTSGVNTYLPLFLLALFARYSHVVQVSPRFQWLVSDQAMLILGVLTVCEILAEKFPVLDHLWDFAHTLVRPVAGALAAGATRQELLETIGVAILMGGRPASMYAAHAMDAIEQFARQSGAGAAG